MKNLVYYFTLFCMTLSVPIQAQNVHSEALTSSMVVETTDGKLIHIKMTLSDRDEAITQLRNLYPLVLTDMYKVTNLTPHRMFLKYDNRDPFLQKGHELKSSQCIYIHKDDFEYLTISVTLPLSEILCSSNQNDRKPLCQPIDYILGFIPSQTELLPYENLKGYHEFSYVSTTSFGEQQALVLLHKHTYSTTQCTLF